MKNGPLVVWIIFRLKRASNTFLLANTSNSFTHKYAATAAARAHPASRAYPSLSTVSRTSTTPPPAALGGETPARVDSPN